MWVQNKERKCGNRNAWLKKANKFQNTSVIVIQVTSETRRDWSPTLSQDSRPWNRVPATKDQSSDKNLVNAGPRNARWRCWGPGIGPDALRPTFTTAEGLSTPGNKVAENGNGNKLLPETATLAGAATMLPFRATICCLAWTGLN